MKNNALAFNLDSQLRMATSMLYQESITSTLRFSLNGSLLIISVYIKI